MKINYETNEITLQFRYNFQMINAVYHTDFNLSNSYVTILVPGIFGDRGDSRAMFTRIARDLCNQGINVLRFDFVGGGSNFGRYADNDFDSFIDQLNEITNQFLKCFGAINKVIYIGFSEGMKFAFHASTKRSDVYALLSCNGLCVEEQCLEKIKRPKIRNGQMVYDSEFGAWCNLMIVEKYNNYFINNSLNTVKFFGIYSTADPYSSNSRIFWEDQGWELFSINNADHLFTRAAWFEEVSSALQQWHSRNVQFGSKRKEEYFLSVQGKRVCVKVVSDEITKDFVVFVHGLFQNKSGPGFLFSQIADKIKKDFSLCMFDFPASGDSGWTSCELTFERMEEVLFRVINHIKEIKPQANIIGIGSGCGNYLILKHQDWFSNALLLFPEQSRLWTRLSTDEKSLQTIDTCDIYEKYDWAEKECTILGNILNRSKGIVLSTELLKVVAQFDIKQLMEDYDGYAFINRKDLCTNKKTSFIDDKDGLVMSAVIRERLIDVILDSLNKMEWKGDSNGQCVDTSI